MPTFLTSPVVPDATASKGAASLRQVGDQFKCHAGTGANDLSTVYPQNVLSTAASSLASRAGKAVFVPIKLLAGTYDAFVVNVATAQVGGSTTFTMALYAENSDGFPDTAAGPLMSATLALTSTTTAATSAGSPVVLVPGNYWTCALYVRSSNPTTEPQLHCITNNGYALPSKGFQAPNACRAWELSGLTVLPVVAMDGSNRVQVGTNDAVYMGVRKSA